MSHMLCDMLPRQYSQALVMSVVKTKASTVAQASAATTQQACVLFSDLVGFTALAEKLSPKDLVDIMHHIWSCFDALVQKYGMHKIDTVGDAFIVIALVKDNDLEFVANEMLTLAKWMVVTLAHVSTAANQPLSIRIGVDTGPIATGIIGTLQRRFHAHGQVVSNAQRLEGLCPHGGVLVSQAIAEQCKADFPNFDKTLNHFNVGGKKVSLARSKSGKQTANKASVANARTLTRAQSRKASFERRQSALMDAENRGGEVIQKAGSLSSLFGGGTPSVSNDSESAASSVRRKMLKVKNAIAATAFLRVQSSETEEDAREALFNQENSQKSRKNEFDEDSPVEKDHLRLAAKGEFDHEAKNLLQQVNKDTDKKMTGMMKVSLVKVSVEMNDATGPAPGASMDDKGKSEEDIVLPAGIAGAEETTKESTSRGEATVSATEEEQVKAGQNVQEQPEVVQHPMASLDESESAIQRLEAAETTDLRQLEEPPSHAAATAPMEPAQNEDKELENEANQVEAVPGGVERLSSVDTLVEDIRKTASNEQGPVPGVDTDSLGTNDTKVSSETGKGPV